jgi:hypothetical protein
MLLSPENWRLSGLLLKALSLWVGEQIVRDMISYELIRWQKWKFARTSYNLFPADCEEQDINPQPI